MIRSLRDHRNAKLSRILLSGDLVSPWQCELISSKVSMDLDVPTDARMPSLAYGVHHWLGPYLISHHQRSLNWCRVLGILFDKILIYTHDWPGMYRCRSSWSRICLLRLECQAFATIPSSCFCRRTLQKNHI